MELIESLKKEIDEMFYKDMLRRWRFAPAGDPMFQGESGEYFSKVMAEKREIVDHVQASKDIGW